MSTTTQDQLSADLAMGTVMLKVGDLKKMTTYYQKALGLDILTETASGVGLGRRGLELVHLADGKGLALPGRGEAGLFHTALLFDTQADLAATVFTAAKFDGQLFTGSSDHLVSEAFYFNDPEGNGIELYWDRPRESWTWNNGQVAMDTLHLDPNAYLNTHLNEQAVSDLSTTYAGIGHVHLQVGDVVTAEKFYVDTLGFAKTIGFHGQALFVSAGGYHHHMAMNVWNSRGAGPRKDTLGLGEVVITVPHADEVAALADRLKVAGVANHHTGAELRFDDPWANKIRVAVG